MSQQSAERQASDAGDFLVVDVRFLLERYHGGEWPPSPRRLFLALVAALYQSPHGRFDTGDGDRALQYLEQQGPPRIEADGKEGTKYTLFVPNNDTDIIAKDYARHGRSAKDPKAYTTSRPMRPYVANAVRYVWTLPPGLTDAQRAAVSLLCRLAGEVPVLGLGIDPVAVCCRLLDAVEPLAGAQAYIPDSADADLVIDVPIKGLLDDAKRRHAEFLCQVTPTGFAKPGPITQKAGHGYRKDVAPVPELMAYRLADTESRHIIPRGAIGELAANLHSLCGSDLGEARAVVLPSIGHRHADASVRRVGLLIPPSMRGARADRLRARLDSKIVTAGGIPFQLVPVKPDDDGVSRMYVQKSRVWRSVVPIDPGDPADGSGRRGAADLLAGELAERGIKNNVTAIRLDKVPDWGGLEGLPKSTNLWYAEIELRSPVGGPLVLGRGTARGLGLLAPAMLPDVAYYAVVGRRPPVTKTVKIADAVRTAVMSQAGRLRRDRYVPQSLSGHDARGRPLRTDHSHASWLPVDNDGDGLIDHVAVYAKNGFEPSTRRAFAAATEVRSRRNHLISLRFVGLYDSEDMATRCPLFGEGDTWTSSTPYYPPWHSKANFGTTEQIKRELQSRRMPLAQRISHNDGAVVRADASTVPARLFESIRSGRNPPHGVGRYMTVIFGRCVKGPVLLGANSHFGLGAFAPIPTSDKC